MNKDEKIQNVLLGAFTFAMGLVVFKIISKHFGKSESLLASLKSSDVNANSEEVAGAYGFDNNGEDRSTELVSRSFF